MLVETVTLHSPRHRNIHLLESISMVDNFHWSGIHSILTLDRDTTDTSSIVRKFRQEQFWPLMGDARLPTIASCYEAGNKPLALCGSVPRDGLEEAFHLRRSLAGGVAFVWFWADADRSSA